MDFSRSYQTQMSSLHFKFIPLHLSLFLCFTHIAILLFEDITAPPSLVFAKADGSVGKKLQNHDAFQSKKNTNDDGNKKSFKHLQTLALDKQDASTAAKNVIKEINQGVRIKFGHKRRIVGLSLA